MTLYGKLYFRFIRMRLCLLFLVFLCFSFSSTPFCPFEFYKTEPYFSLPLLSVLHENRIKTDFMYEQPRSRAIDSRAFHSNSVIDSFSHDYTRDNSSSSDVLDMNIRLASLPMVARNIINDIFVQRIGAIGRFLKIASNIWDS